MCKSCLCMKCGSATTDGRRPHAKPALGVDFGEVELAVVEVDGGTADPGVHKSLGEIMEDFPPVCSMPVPQRVPKRARRRIGKIISGCHLAVVSEFAYLCGPTSGVPPRILLSGGPDVAGIEVSGLERLPTLGLWT